MNYELKLKILYGRVYQTYQSPQFRKLALQKSIDAAAVDGHRHQLALDSLAAKPWTDEFSTLVFSLASFRVVPLSEAITLMSLLAPLQPNLKAGITQVVLAHRKPSSALLYAGSLVDAALVT